MPQRPAARARGFFSRGAFLSLLVHFNVVGPIALAAWVYGGEEEARRAEEVDVAFEDPGNIELPKDLPPIEEASPNPLQPLTPEPQKPDQPKRPQLAQEDKKKEEQKTPEEKKEVLPQPQVAVPPPEPPPPAPPAERRAHEKLVDLDTEKETEPPPDAKYLAEKNNRVAEETRARDTNLEKAKKGEASESSPSERDDPEPGSEKQKIAELEDVKSALGRKAPDVTPHVDPEVSAPKREVEPPRKSLLALRDPSPRTHELTPETADLSLPRADDGVLQQDRAVRGHKSDPAHIKDGKQVKLALAGADYEYMFGADAEADRRLAQTLKSTKQGKFQQRSARLRAALENFIPEVKPGNTTALNTRAAPFAAYIARMHRSIHKLWGFGQLEDWDELSGSSPLNNSNLLTTLELVLNRDGTVEKVTIVRASGYLPYDAAAIDVAYSAGPYPDPPRAIRSANGKIYVHWRFYRDERQCATSGVDYYILDNAPKGGDDPEGPVIAEGAEGGGTPHTHGAEGGAPHAHGGEGGASATNGAQLGAQMFAPPAAGPATAATPRPLGAAPAGAAQPTLAANTTGDGGLRRLQRFDKATHRGGTQRLNQEVAAAEGRGTATGGAPASASAAKPVVARASDSGAKAIAVRWFGALAAGDARMLTNLSSLPFKTSGKEVSNRGTLASMLSDLAQEGSGGSGGNAQVYTAAGLRAAIGKLPPNLDDGTGKLLFAVASSGSHDTLILILDQRGGRWEPVGLVRR